MEETKKIKTFVSNNIKVQILSDLIQPRESRVEIIITTPKMTCNIEDSINFAFELSLELADAIRIIKQSKKELPKNVQISPFIDEKEEISEYGPAIPSLTSGRRICMNKTPWNKEGSTKILALPKTTIIGTIEEMQANITVVELVKMLTHFILSCKEQTNNSVIELCYCQSKVEAKKIINVLNKLGNLTAFIRIQPIQIK